MSPTKKPATRKKPAGSKPSGSKPAGAKKKSFAAKAGGIKKKLFGKGKGAGRGAASSSKKKPAAPKMTRGKAKSASTPPAAPAENPRAKAMAKRIAELVLDKKASDVVILDVRGKTSYADYMVIASGESDRQVSAMADAVSTGLKADGVRAVGSEGQETGNWVLLDFGEVVAHLFFSEVRGFYDLEGLWADAPRERVA